MYRTEFWTLWEKARAGCFKRSSSKHVCYLGWSRSPAQVGCMRQVLGPGALGRPRGITWRGRWEGGSGWGIHINPWLIHVNIWPKPLQHCKVIILQLIKINEKKNKKEEQKHKKIINNASSNYLCLLSAMTMLKLFCILTHPILISTLWGRKVKSPSRVWLFVTPWAVAY